MLSMRSIMWAAAFAVAALGTGAQAAVCDGDAPFDDVSSSAIYCSNVAWLANRSITAGCDATYYCPDQSVTRAQMALFMSRLAAKVIEPPSLFQGVVAGGSITSGRRICAHDVYPAAPYPRKLVISASLSISGGGAPGSAFFTPQMSLDGGETWDPGNALFHGMGFPDSGWSSGTVPAVYDVPAGQVPRLAVWVQTAFVGSSDTGTIVCHVIAQAQSMMGMFPPY